MPSQDRAHYTCELIYEATAQIIESKGECTLTTNKIAERAGISIGTLYQYFPDKNAIVLALAARAMKQSASSHRQAIIAQQSESGKLQAALHAYIHTMKDKPRTRKALLRTIVSTASPAELARSSDETSRLLPKIAGASRLDNFILSRAVSGIVRAAVLEDYDKLYTPEFERALLRLISGYARSLAAE